MLILSRKTDETIVIRVPPSGLWTEIRVLIVEIKSGKDTTRLGFTAPKAVTIHREEIQERVDAENGSPLGDDYA